MQCFPGQATAEHLKACQSSGAGTELLRFDAQPLEHGHVEVAEGRWVIRVEGQVLAVLQAASSQKDRQIPGGMAARVAQVAAEEDPGSLYPTTSTSDAADAHAHTQAHFRKNFVHSESEKCIWN